jgi:hypothetical protein
LGAAPFIKIVVLRQTVSGMRVFNGFFIALFVLFAVLQYNDPDPYVWIPIYLYAAFLCYRALQKMYDPVLYLIGFVLFGGYALYLFFDKTGVLSWANEHGAENIAQTMKATKPWIEETREFGGLAIILIVLLINFFWLRRHGKSALSR